MARAKAATKKPRGAGGAGARSPNPVKAETQPSHGRGRSKRPGGSLEAGLYLVATPIGNLGDLTQRARALLPRVDVVACEDTRVTGRLLSALGLRAKLIAYHDHNAARMRPRIIERLKNGESVALVSDAGTPLVSDPGFKLVEAAVAEGLPVTCLPGPSAPLAALLLSGLPSDRFFFGGFLPTKSARRRAALEPFCDLKASLIFFESAARLVGCLEDMGAVLGPRQAAVARELTKRFEEVRRGTLDALAAHYLEAGPPKGEIVVVVGPPEAGAARVVDPEAVDRALRAALARSSTREAAAEVAAAVGLPRREVYARALLLKEAAAKGKGDG